MKSLLIVLLCYYANQAAGFDESDIVFCIFAQQPRNISYKDFNLLPETGFNKKLPTIFVIHGFQSGYALLESFRQDWSGLATKMNLIGIDWSKGSSTWNYNTAVSRTPTVGSAVGQFIMSSIRNNLIPDPRIIHVVGHSLGAHIAGFVGKYMAASIPFPATLEHITALDPAGPFIGSYDCSRRLCVTDAAFVETLHTNGGALGMWEAIGSLDMYLNGGISQPGCWLPTCSHSFSHEWYR
ncbi:phospholipase A1-like, partial [Bradysia coprophila]|uniref:phospholipase A1-like n=1 Tax=Bradysia coprophila TaxID=38358 RepID=UPI00187DB974